MKIRELIMKFLVPTVRKYILQKLEAKKDEIIKFINDKINLPKLNEEQEKELLEGIYDVILAVLKAFTK